MGTAKFLDSVELCWIFVDTAIRKLLFLLAFFEILDNCV